MKSENRGRSMIEMLGVLALIAVLTVGGIEGFGKAMQMWKSNIQRQAIAELMAATIKMKPNLNSKSTTWDNVTSVIYAMGDLPEGTTYKNGGIYDKEGNHFDVIYGLQTIENAPGQTSQSFNYVIRLFFNGSSSSLTPSMRESCRNVMLAVQPLVYEIKSIVLYQTDSTSYTNTSGRTLFTKATLATATIKDIQEKCQQTVENGKANRITIFLNPY